MAYKLSRQPLPWFKRAANIRTANRSEESRRQMWESLKVRQLHPLLCRSDGTVVDGYLRLDSADLGGITHLDVIITDEDLSPEQISEIQFLSAFFREDITGYDRWQALERIKSAHPDWQSKDIADRLKIDSSMVTRLLSPGKCIEQARSALRDGKIGISDCYAISKLPEAEQAGLLALKLSGASRDAIEKAGRKTRNGSKEAVRVQKVKCILPGGVSVVVSGEGVSLDESIEALGEAIKEMKRARELGYTAKTFAAAMRDKAKREGCQ